MILIGQYDSPFVRRVGIALTMYAMPFEHKPWSTFGDADLIRPYNPLTRVPTLVLDDGTALVESHGIIDYLDGLVPSERALFPRSEPQRHRALRIAGLATGFADKAVSLFYEKRLHSQISELWVERCRGQIKATLTLLEGERKAEASPFWGGDHIGHADIAVATALRFLTEAHPGLVAMTDHPCLAADAAHCEARPEFLTIQQTFVPPS